MRSKKLSLSDKKREAILNCLKHIEENATISSDGKSSITVDILYDFVKEILREYLPIGESFPERTKRGIVFSSQMRWLKYKRTDNPQQKINLFIRAVKAEIEKIQKKRSTYKVIMFLNIDTSTIPDFLQVDIMGDTLKFVAWQDVDKQNISGLWQEVKSQNKDNPLLWDIPELIEHAPDTVKFAPIVFETNTYGPEAAIEIASDRVDLLRAIFNIPSTLGGYTYFRSQPKALSEILPSPIYVIFNQEGKRVSVYYTIEKFDYQQKKIPEDRISSIQFLLSKVELSPDLNSTWAYLLNVLRLYQKALDTSTTEAAYLTMWQVLENCIGLGEELTRNRDIQSRISVFMKADPISLEMIDIIIDRRNKLVHSGKFLEDGDHLFFILKLITDTIIRRLIYLADKYPSLSELKDYISFSSLGDGDLERKQSVIDKIIMQRKNG